MRLSKATMSLLARLSLIVILGAPLASSQQHSRLEIRNFYKPRAEQARKVIGKCQAALSKSSALRSREESNLAEDCRERLDGLRNLLGMYEEWERLIHLDDECEQMSDKEAICSVQRKTLRDLETELDRYVVPPKSEQESVVVNRARSSIWASLPSKDIKCAYDEGERGGYAVVSGIQIELTKISDKPDENMCRLELYGQGPALFKIEDQTLSVIDAGADANGDGAADLVVQGISGGAHPCCSTVSVISLGPQPHLIAKIDSDSNSSVVDSDADGRVEVWFRSVVPDKEREDGIPEYIMRQSGPLLVAELDGSQFRFVPNKFKDVYTRRLLKEMADLRANPMADWFKRSGGLIAPLLKSMEDRPAENLMLFKFELISTAMELMYVDRDEEASGLLQELWPPSDVKRVTLSLQQRVHQTSVDTTH